MLDPLKDKDEIDQDLASTEFNPTHFINKYLTKNDAPNFQDLMKQLESRNISLKKSIHDDIQSYSVLGDKSEKMLSTAKSSILELSLKIKKINESSIKTGTLVQKISEGIKPLDNAKQNLTKTVTTLKQVQMIQMLLEELFKNIEMRNYSDCASNVLGLDTIFNHFSRYLEKPQLKNFYLKFIEKKRTLRGIVSKEFENMFRTGSINESNLDLCKVVDALGEDVRTSLISLFSEFFFQPYDSQYKTAKLPKTSARYDLFKQRMELFNQKFAIGFPESWRIQYHLTLTFCDITKSHFDIVFQEGEPNVKDYLSSFELTVKFEQKMAKSFSTLVEIPFDPNAVMPNFSQDAEGVQQKLKWIENQKKQIPSKQIVQAKEFLGSIAIAFRAYLRLYVENEKKELAKIVNDAVQSAKNDVDLNTKQISSADNVVLEMKKTMEKCATFGDNLVLNEIFQVLKQLIIQYVTGLAGLKSAKVKSDDHIQFVCFITNTVSTFLQIPDSLASRILELTNQAVDVELSKNTIGNNIKDLIHYLAEFILKENEQHLISIGMNNWKTDHTSADKLPFQMTLKSRLIFLVPLLSTENVSRFRSVIVPMVHNSIRTGLFKLKHLPADCGMMIKTTIDELKSSLILWLKAESELDIKRIKTSFLQIENELTVLTCPIEAIVITYLTKVKHQSKENFITIIKMKGLTQELESSLIKEFDSKFGKYDVK